MKTISLPTSASCRIAVAVSLFAVGISVSSQVSAQLEIKGIRIGMTKEELKTAHPGINCGAGNECNPLNAKTLSTLADIPVKQWSFHFSDDGKLKRSTVTLSASVDRELKAALIDKFGKPAAVNTTEYKMRGGRPSVTKTESVWVDGDSYLAVKYPADLRFTEISVELYSRAQVDAETEASKAKRRKDL